MSSEVASTVPLEFWKLPLPKAQIASTVSLRFLEQTLFPNTKSQAPWPFVFFYPPPSLHPYTPMIASTVSLSLLWKLTLPKSQIASTVSLRFLEQNLFPNTKSQAPWPCVFFYPPPSLHPYTPIIASTVSLSLLWKLTLPKSQIASAVPLSFFLKILPEHSIASTVPLEFWKPPLPKAQIASTVSLRFLEQNPFPNTKSQAPWPFVFFYPPPSLHPYTSIIASTVSLSLLWKLTLPKSQIASAMPLSFF